MLYMAAAHVPRWSDPQYSRAYASGSPDRPSIVSVRSGARGRRYKQRQGFLAESPNQLPGRVLPRGNLSRRFDPNANEIGRGVADSGLLWVYVDPLDRINNHRESLSKLKINLQENGAFQYTFLQL